MTYSIRDVMLREMLEQALSDDEDTSYMVERLYTCGNPLEKDLIDQILICLCGWSFNSLKAKAQKLGGEE